MTQDDKLELLMKLARSALHRFAEGLGVLHVNVTVVLRENERVMVSSTEPTLRNPVMALESVIAERSAAKSDAISKAKKEIREKWS